MYTHLGIGYGFTVVTIICDIFCHGYEVTENELPAADGEGVEWMLMPDGQGNVQVAILSGLEPRYSPQVDTVNYYLYTRDNANRAEKRSMNETCLPIFKYFKPQRKSKVLIHGFGDNAEESLMYPILKNALLEHGDYNVFLVDWGEMAATPWYRTAARNTMLVGKHNARLLDHLHQSTGARMDDFHIIGFSLGAHVAGITGKHVKSGRIKKITALDPAQVLFKKAKPEEMLGSSDAEDVEAVHTSGDYLAFKKPLGHRDFYPNSGTWPQPGCTLDYASVCSHRRAYYYYAEALRTGRGFMGTPCDSWENFSAGKCDGNDEKRVHMANDSKNGKLKGNYYLYTNSKEPFGKSTKPKRRPIADD